MHDDDFKEYLQNQNSASANEILETRRNLENLVGRMIKHVPPVRPSPTTYPSPNVQSPVKQVMPANPTIKSSLDPRTSVNINSTLKTAQMFLDFGDKEMAVSYFNRVLENEPNNTLAIEGLKKAQII